MEPNTEQEHFSKMKIKEHELLRDHNKVKKNIKKKDYRNNDKVWL